MANLHTFLDPARDSLKAISRSIIQLAVSGAGSGWIVIFKGTGKGYTVDTMSVSVGLFLTGPTNESKLVSAAPIEYEFEFEDDKLSQCPILCVLA
jgi:hypothetical protein